jgi:aminoglycoside phosphotransferase (APT) family kinase protein
MAAMTEQVPTELRRSTRSADALRERMQQWLRGHHPDATITDLGGTSATGMSSDTVLFDATWTDESGQRPHGLVARLAPDPGDVPVFPSYDLTRQFELIRAVDEHTDVPVPATFWNEPSPEALGTQFFVMERVDGEVPPDVLPYNFGDSWLFAAAPEQQQALQDATVDLLARLHEMPTPDFLEFDAPGDSALRRHVAHTRAWYEFVAADAEPSPLIEQGFDWLDANWPDESPPVVSWGDARIGNILYRDFRPAAVLDWEMAGVGPRELDVAWLIHAHRSFEDIARLMSLPGMPHFLRREDVVARYAAATGYEPRDLDFYETYAAVQWGIVFLRTGTRQVRFGERERPADVDELLFNREPLQRMLAGTYF